MPHICLDCRTVKPRTSGIGQIVRILAENLPDLAPDWQFTFLRHKSATRQFGAVANVREIELAAEANGPISMWALPLAIDMSGIDLFHAPANILPAGLSSIKRVTTIHDLMWLDRPELCGSGLWHQIERRFYRHGIRRALRSSDAIITVSDATRADVLAHEPTSAQQVAAIHPAIACAPDPCLDINMALDRMGLQQGRFVLTVGQAAPYKNHAGALRGFAEAFGNDDSQHMVFVQRRGAAADSLLALARSLGVDGRVHVLPHIAQDDLECLYGGAFALLHPSLHEGFGLPLAEAMARGCPVITSACSAMPEVTGGAAILVDPHSPSSIADALVQLHSDTQLRAKLRDEGYERVHAFDRLRFAKSHLEVYRRVLAR